MSGKRSALPCAPRGDRPGRGRRRRRAGWLGAALLALGCRSGPPPAAELDSAHEPCAWCRMTVSSREFAAQIVAPAEEPRFFDDLGCLRDYLAGGGTLPGGAVVYVADHRSRDWVRGAVALYTRQPILDTPMGSHLLAHADALSRTADPAAAGGQAVPASELYGGLGAPDGTP